MILRAISDLHGRLPAVAPCDVLVIAGDVCPHQPGGRVGSFFDCRYQADWLDTTFRRWLDAVPAEHVVATWGNHDWVGEREPSMVPRDLRWRLLVDSGFALEGLRFWGSPWSPWFNDWAFNSPPGDAVAGEPWLRQRWAQIPDDIDVLIVHGPPARYGDRTVDGRHEGSPALLDRIVAVQPRLSVHGHIHEGRGRWEVGQTTVANASVLDVRYQLVHPPMEFEL